MDDGSYRRDVLKALGGLGIGGAVAGSAVLSGDASANHEAQVLPADAAFSNWIDDNPPDQHFNRYNTTYQTDFAHFLTFEPTTKWDYANAEFQNWAITEWEMVDDTTFEFTVDTDITWSNGDSYTSLDMATQLRLSQVNRDQLWDFVDSIETPDDSTVRLNLPDGANPQIIKLHLNDTYLHTKHSEYERYLDGVGDYADETVADELLSMTEKEPMTNGPFGEPQYNQQRMLLSRQDNYFKSENITFDEYEMRYIQGNQQVWQELLGSSIDGVWSLFTPPRIVADFPDTVIESAIPAYWGYGILPQHENEHTGNQNVRQALMHVINRDAVVRNAGPRTKVTPEIPTCLPTSQVDNWIGDSKDDYETYGYSQSDPSDNLNADQATQLLNEAGYSKDGGTWKKGGSPVSLPIMTPAGWSDWMSASQTIADQLSSFGFNASVDAVGGSFWTRLPEGDFTLSAYNWIPGTVEGSHPYFCASHQFVGLDATTGYNYEPSNEVENKIEALSVATATSEIESLVSDLTIASNTELPVLPISEKLDQSFVNSDRFDVPDRDSDNYLTKWPSAWLVRNGDITHPASRVQTPTETEAETTTTAFRETTDTDTATMGRETQTTTAPTEPLVAEFEYEPAEPNTGQEVEFDAGDSSGDIDEYEWRFGDGTEETGETVTHTFESGGVYTVRLVVTGAEGDESEAAERVAVGGDSDDSGDGGLEVSADGPGMGVVSGLAGLLGAGYLRQRGEADDD